MIEDQAQSDSVLYFFRQPWSIPMRGELTFVLVAFLTGTFAIGQQAAPPTPPPATNAPSATQTAYYAGPGVIAPELLPITLSDAVTGECNHFDAKVILSVVVDATGAPHNVYFLNPSGYDLDLVAIKLAMAESFRPGTLNGAPATTVDSLEMNIKACTEEAKNELGQKVKILHLQSVPLQKISLQEPPSDGATLTLSSTSPSQPGDSNPTPFKVGGGISAPKIIFQPQAVYSEKALKERLQGICEIEFVVDEHGMPHNLHMTKSLEPSMDQSAADAVRRYRFTPAMKKDGTPVPTIIKVEVDFHLGY
jgi:TonB family protein